MTRKGKKTHTHTHQMWLGEDAKGLLDTRSKGLPRVFFALTQRPLLLRRCNPNSHQCKSGAQEEPQSQRIARTAPKNFLNNSRGYRSLPNKASILRQIAPESSPESSAKSLSQKFFGVPFLGCKIPWPFFSRKPPALTSINRRKPVINPEIASMNVC